MIDIMEFRQAMSRLAATVNIIATDGPAGRHGMTASAVCSVSDDPPTLLACINRSSTMNARIKANGVMSVNVLADAQALVCKVFANAKTPPSERFASGDWAALVSGAPVLAGSVAVFDCTIESVAEVGTHSVFFGRLVAMRGMESGTPLLYFNRTFHTLGLPAAA